MGARPLARIIQEHVRKPLADEVLFGRLAAGGWVRVLAEKGTDGVKKIGFQYLSRGKVRALPGPAERKALPGKHPAPRNEHRKPEPASCDTAPMRALRSRLFSRNMGQFVTERASAMMASGAVALTYLGAVLFALSAVAAFVVGLLCRRYAVSARLGALLALPTGAVILFIMSIDFGWGTAASGSIVIAAVVLVLILLALGGQAVRRVGARLRKADGP